MLYEIQRDAVLGKSFIDILTSYVGPRDGLQSSTQEASGSRAETGNTCFCSSA